MKSYFKLCVLIALVVSGYTNPIAPPADEDRESIAEVICTLKVLLTSLAYLFDTVCKLTFILSFFFRIT